MRALLRTFAFIALCSTPTYAAVFLVTNSADAGPGSLRQAILDSNATPGPNVIEFAFAGTPPYIIKPQGQFLPPLKGPVVVRMKGATTELNFPAGGRGGGGGRGAPREAVTPYVAPVPVVVLDGSNLVKPRTPDDCPGQTAHYSFQTNRWEYSGARGSGPNVRGYYGAGLAVYESRDVEISGVEIRNFCIGIATIRSSNVTIHDVKVVDSHGAAGVIFTGDDGSSSSTALSFNNRLFNSVLLDNGDGFEFTRGTHDSLIQGNTIALTQPLPVEGNAVEFASSGDNNAVIGNTFTKYVETAMTVSGNHHTIRDNKIIENKGSGMRSNGSNLLILGNTFAHNGGSGFSVSGASTRVLENVITGNGAQGIIVGGPRVTLSRNSIYSNAKLGIDATPAETPIVPNAPALDSSSKWNATGIFLNGSMTGTPRQTYSVELYVSRVADAGQMYLGTASATTDASGKAPFTIQIRVSDPFGDGHTTGFFTAIATDSTGSTSKFSRSISLNREK